MEADKRANGVYYTEGNPFNNPAFLHWAALANLKRARVLEPFAGKNNLIATLRGMGLCGKFKSYDICPQHGDVLTRDTLQNFPAGYDVCVTNPPWLAKNSAAARGIAFPATAYDDIYKLALEKCLSHCGWVAALVPESFIKAGVFQRRLLHFISLSKKMFSDTGHPVGAALFAPDETKDVIVWRDGEKTGRLSAIKQTLRPRRNIPVSFNDPKGNVGLIALDNTIKASIRFCDVRELRHYQVKATGRHITKITVDGEIKIRRWNDCLNAFRAETKDVLMTCYKGARKDGWYRRRLDWRLARDVINSAG